MFLLTIRKRIKALVFEWDWEIGIVISNNKIGCKIFMFGRITIKSVSQYVSLKRGQDVAAEEEEVVLSLIDNSAYLENQRPGRGTSRGAMEGS